MRIVKSSNIPNALSVFRLLLVPAFVWLFLEEGKHLLAIAVFLFAGLTDVVDGFLARRYNWTSNIGKILDPFADKCMQIAALVCLGKTHIVAWWIVYTLVLKEFVLLIGALFALGRKKVYVQSSWYGKAGTVAFYIIATLLVVVDDMSDPLRLVLGFSLIMIMFFALIMYCVNYKRKIMKKGKTEANISK